MPGQDSAGCGPHGRQHRGVAPRAEPPGRAARRQPAGCAAGALLWLGARRRVPQGSPATASSPPPTQPLAPAAAAVEGPRRRGCGGAPTHPRGRTPQRHWEALSPRRRQETTPTGTPSLVGRIARYATPRTHPVLPGEPAPQLRTGSDSPPTARAAAQGPLAGAGPLRGPSAQRPGRPEQLCLPVAGPARAVVFLARASFVHLPAVSDYDPPLRASRGSPYLPWQGGLRPAAAGLVMDCARQACLCESSSCPIQAGQSPVSQPSEQ